MPEPDRREFRGDVVKVARGRPEGRTLEQVAAGFGIRTVMLWTWLRQAAVGDGGRPGVSSSESAGNRELRKRVRLFGQGNEVLRRAAASFGEASLRKG